MSNKPDRCSPHATDAEQLRARLRSISVSKDGGSTIRDLTTYFKNAPNLKDDVEALEKIKVGPPPPQTAKK